MECLQPFSLRFRLIKLITIAYSAFYVISLSVIARLVRKTLSGWLCCKYEGLRPITFEVRPIHVF